MNKDPVTINLLGRVVVLTNRCIVLDGHEGIYFADVVRLLPKGGVVLRVVGSETKRRFDERGWEVGGDRYHRHRIETASATPEEIERVNILHALENAKT